MPTELEGEKQEKANSKVEKDIDRVDKEFLSKAKNSRDIIDKKLRTFENSIEDISDSKKEEELEKKKKLDEYASNSISTKYSSKIDKLANFTSIQ